MTIAADRAMVKHVSLKTIVALLVAFVALLAYISLFRNSLIDDAFITLKYAQTLALSGTWGFFPGRVTNTATSPLNVLLTALFTLVAPSPVDGVVWLTAIEFLVILVFLLLISERLFSSPSFAVLAFVGLLSNPLLLSTIGLEAVLFTLWIVASMYFFVSQRWLMLAVALGLLTLTRADGFLLFAVCFVFLPVPIKTRLEFTAVYGLVIAPWHLYSWVHLGSVIPDTMKIKMFQRAWRPTMTFTRGLLLYVRVFPLATVVSLALLPFGVFAIGRSNRATTKLIALVGIYGLGHFLAYSALRVPPYHWYYVSQAVPGVLIGSLGLTSLYNSLRQTTARQAVVAGGLLLPIAGMAAVLYRGGLPIKEVPIQSNWATHETYREMGLWLKANTDPSAVIFCAAEIGTLAFYSDRFLINEFSDMNRISESIVNGSSARIPVVGALMRLNYYWRTLENPFPPDQFRLQGRAMDETTRAKLTQDAVKTWDVSTRFMKFLEPDRPIVYWLTPIPARSSDRSAPK
jgi:hypothetical protein